MAGGRGVILDRDGVINLDRGFLYRVEDVVFVDGIFELLLDFRKRGFRLIVATNQSGIGRGLFGEDDFQRLTGWMQDRFAERGIVIDAVYHCPYHPTEGIGPYRRDSDWRKPAPGMFLKAIGDFDLDPSASWAIGDQDRDMAAATAAGIGHRVLLQQGETETVRSDGIRIVPALDAVGRLLTEVCGASEK